MDHCTVTVKQGEVIGLKPEDFDKAEVPPMVRACFYAWHHWPSKPVVMNRNAPKQILRFQEIC